MSFHAYLPRCADGSYCTGHTDDLDQRIAQHQHGAVPGHFRPRRPVGLMWSEDVPSGHDARAGEQRITGWPRAKRQALESGDAAAARSRASRVVLRAASAGSVPLGPNRGWRS
ncbi:GIY-YIG nuclease family protein [Sphingomonas sp.]|uniref:GIY-YIG nuclease family protein n=1 Tax=Sphingomonas sp. TaxID=28214 RepID=UPI0035C7F889